MPRLLLLDRLLLLYCPWMLVGCLLGAAIGSRQHRAGEHADRRFRVGLLLTCWER